MIREELELKICEILGLKNVHKLALYMEAGHPIKVEATVLVRNHKDLQEEIVPILQKYKLVPMEGEKG